MKTVATILLSILVLCPISGASAITIDDFNLLRDTVRKNSVIQGLSNKDEADQINEFWVEYLGQHREASIPVVGQVSLAAVFPVSMLGRSTAAELNFFFVDTTSLLPGSGPSVSSVFYEVNVDPLAPDVYAALGTSFDPASDFSLSFLITDFEPVVRATPFDSLGNPVVITGVGGFNVAVGSVVNIPLPEPSAPALILIGLMGLFLQRYRPKSLLRAR